MRAILERAQAGDETVLPELKKLLDSAPKLWQQLGDLGVHAEQALLGLIGGKSLLAREIIERKIAAITIELSGPNPSALERILAERAALAWAAVSFAEINLSCMEKQAKVPLQQRNHAMRFLDRANYRFLASLKAIALVRKLLKPPLGAKPIIDRQMALSARSKRRRKRSAAETIPAAIAERLGFGLEAGARN
jgi:hypothetical protein